MKIITAHSFRGGTGKTNIIANLSYILAKSGKKVGIVDADATHPSLHIIFGLGDNPPSPTFGDFLLNQCSIQDIVFDISEKCGLKNSLYLIPGKLDDATIYKIIQINQTSFHIQNVFKALRDVGQYKNLDYLLIDTKPELDERVLLYMLNSEIILIVTRHDEADIRGTKELLKRLCCIPGNIIHIVPNLIKTDDINEKMRQFRGKFDEFDPTRVVVKDPILYSNTLCNVHAPQIDMLFIVKYPDDPFVISLKNMANSLF